MPKHRILVIDDDELMREYMEEAMIRAGHGVDTASNGADALELFNEHYYDLVITDLKMSPMDGLQVVESLHKLNPAVAVVMMTAYGTIETAVSALKAGATDYILKPFTLEALELTVTRSLEHSRLTLENRFLRAELDALYDFGPMVGVSDSMQEIYEQIRRLADSRATVLIRGESGTGKELVARAIHNASNRSDQSFIRVNCAALSAGILESELFGHERGAFTNAHERKIGRFELADKGSILLDEISEIGIDLQPKLLRVLQEQEFERVGGTDTIPVDARIIATSNRNLEEAVEEGLFRGDLFFRLNVITLTLPPLRERKDDIPALMDHFLKRYTQENKRRIKGFSAAARKLFMNYDWPGNVRELQNAIERAVVLSMDETLDAAHFQLNAGVLLKTDAAASALTPGTTVAEMEKQLIFHTLGHCNQNRTQAAELLGISVRTLRNKLKEYQEVSEQDG